jgi:hypothetical protein
MINYLEMMSEEAHDLELCCVCLSTWNNSAPTGLNFIKYDIGEFFQNFTRIFDFHYNLTRIRDTLD